MASIRSPLTILLGAALALAVSACTDELAGEPMSGARQAPLRQAATTPPAAPQLPLDPAFDPEAEAALKRSAGPTLVITEADARALAAWPRLAADEATLGDEARAVLRDVPLPVLVPDPRALAGGLTRSVATRGEHWYALSTHTDDGLNILVTGNRAAVVHARLEEIDLEPLLRDGRFVLGRTHGVVTVTFRAFGEIAYSVDVECARPLDDPRCTEDDFALELARGLLVAGGGQP